MPPYLTDQHPWFTFLIHPRTARDLHRVGGSSIVAEHSADEAEFCAKMCTLPPTVVGDIRFGFGPVWGEMVGVLRMPGPILRPEGRRSIVEAAQLAAKRGSSVIGLGALTAPATRGGLTLLPELPKGVTLTTGNAFTAVVAHRNVAEAAAAMQLGTRATVAVVGCTGSVGVAASWLLADAGFDLILIGRTPARVERELSGLAGRARLSANLPDIAHADIVLLLTSDQSALLGPELPRPDSVVIDFAQPVNIDPEDYERYQQRAVAVVQGGLVRIPEYYCSLEFGLPDPRTTLACLAETYLFAKEGIREHSVGLASVELARHLDQVATGHGVHTRPLGLKARDIAVG